MDPQIDLPELVEDLEVNIDELETTLAPLLSNPIHTTAASLPLLDKAKLYVLSAYAIESLLFSTLQASGANAKEHPIFRELARLKGYFGKIKEVEGSGEQPKTRLDKAAAARFIKHGLAGNDKYDLERAERIAKEKARAALKARQMHLKFDQEAEGAKQVELAKKRKAEEVEQEDSSEEEADHVDSENEDFYGNDDHAVKEAGAEQNDEPAKKKPRVSTSGLESDDQEDGPSSATTPTSSKKRKKKNKKSKGAGEKMAIRTPSGPALEASEGDLAPQSTAEENAAKQMQRKKKTKRGREKIEELVLPERAPRTHSETFKSLLEGSFADQKEKEKAKPKKGKKR